jgi:ferredoxin-NADP reductase
MRYKCKILATYWVTHDVRRYVVEKPEGFKFRPGQATEVAIEKEGFSDKRHPFTFTGLNSDRVLEFTIKTYLVSENDKHEGVTEELSKLSSGDEITIGDAWGTIHYEKPGVFIAGGAGITPFLAIFRDLNLQDKLAGNKLIYTNKTTADIICQQELMKYFSGDNLVLTITREGDKSEKIEKRRIDKGFLREKIKDFSQNFYVCGPRKMVNEMREMLVSLGASDEKIVYEK